MYGEIVKIGDLEIFVACVPNTSPHVILEMAAKQVRAWRSEPDFNSQGNSIAFRHNITIAR